MNKLITLCVIAFTGITFVSAQKIEFKNIKDATVDYETIEKGSEGLFKVVIKNDGKEPLIIKNVSSSCGCTVPDWTKEPIKPRKTGFINVKYNTSRVGAINKMLTVTSNDVDTPSQIIKVKGTVVEENSKTTETGAKVKENKKEKKGKKEKKSGKKEKKEKESPINDKL
ncbi:MAG: DUF1573 domain-containing protein [Flavobacteriales bacterium]|nr:DUF1573 domain-containing protein [Flavobacteriales bacterium]